MKQAALFEMDEPPQSALAAVREALAALPTPLEAESDPEPAEADGPMFGPAVRVALREMVGTEMESAGRGWRPGDRVRIAAQQAHPHNGRVGVVEQSWGRWQWGCRVRLTAGCGCGAMIAGPPPRTGSDRWRPQRWSLHHCPGWTFAYWDELEAV